MKKSKKIPRIPVSLVLLLILGSSLRQILYFEVENEAIDLSPLLREASKDMSASDQVLSSPMRRNRGKEIGKKIEKHSKVELTDNIMKKANWGNPIVIPEYKLVFFTIPKVACTQWKLLFRKMLGFPDWDPAVKLVHLHSPLSNGLKYISDYTVKEAQEMLTSDEWTRAVFVREPKERIISAFLDKFVNNSFLCDMCLPKGLPADSKKRLECRQEGKNKNFPRFLKRARQCSNLHFKPQADGIDAKWWPYMTFVGYMDTVASDTERLLRSIHSTSTGENAWDAYGKTGWGKNGIGAFMSKNEAPHSRNAHDKLREYFTTCTEAFVEKHWQSEWTHDTYHFDTFHLFEDESMKKDCDTSDW